MLWRSTLALAWRLFVLARSSPLLPLHHTGEALLSPYGGEASDVLLVEAFDPVEVEYAALRRHAAIFDQPHRATLHITGAERIEFLNRMLTQELKGFAHNSAKRSFWLNRKGRIDADLRLINLPDRVLLDVDVHAADRTLTGLSAFVISEDVTIEDQTNLYHRLGLHGPAGAAILANLSQSIAGAPIADILPGQVSILRLGDAEIIVDRQDIAGEIGLELLVPSADIVRVYEAISTPWSARAKGGITPSTSLARRIGWHALNIARLEAGTPLYYADFGPDSLPHETGQETLHDRVSFKKGCYLGQEVVARMNALGHPKQRLVALRISPPTLTHPDERYEQAVTGTKVVEKDEPASMPVGAVTSSCMSPMLGNVPIALAMMKWSHASEGTQVWVDAGGPRQPGVVREGLRVWKR